VVAKKSHSPEKDTPKSGHADGSRSPRFADLGGTGLPILVSSSRMKQEAKKWGKVIQAANIKAE
jgi:hypothetical protein